MRVDSLIGSGKSGEMTKFDVIKYIPAESRDVVMPSTWVVARSWCSSIAKVRLENLRLKAAKCVYLNVCRLF